MRSRVVRGGRLAGLVIAAAWASAGCVDFVAPEEPGLPDLSAQLVMLVTLADVALPPGCADPCPQAEQGTVAVSAQFFPGTDRDGWLRPVATDTLRIMGTPVLPASIDDEGWRRYESTWEVPSPGDEGAAVPVSLPAPLLPESPESAAPAIAWYAAGRGGSRRVRVGPDDATVLLPLGERPGVTSPSPTFERWQVELSGGGPLFTFGTTGPPPSPLVIPAAWLPWSATGLVQAKLVLDQRVSLELPGANYAVTGLLRVEVHWTLELPDPGENSDE